LTKIARDIFAIPFSTVASESAFSTSGRVLSEHRSRLTPEILEALMCSQDWMRRKYIGVYSVSYISFSHFLIFFSNNCYMYFQMLPMLTSLSSRDPGRDADDFLCSLFSHMSILLDVRCILHNVKTLNKSRNISNGRIMSVTRFHISNGHQTTPVTNILRPLLIKFGRCSPILLVTGIINACYL
jgi:hypothetical protein